MTFIRDWTYRKMTKLDLYEPLSPLTILMFFIIMLGILLDCIF